MHKNLCLGFMSQAEFDNGGGDLIGGPVTGIAGVQWLPPGLEDKRGEMREGDTDFNTLRGGEKEGEHGKSL